MGRRSFVGSVHDSVGLIKLVYRIDKAIERESSMSARQKKTSQSVTVHVMTFVSRNGMTGMVAELGVKPSMMQ